MVPHKNSAPPLSTATKTLEDCFNDCITDAACKYWTFDQDAGSCSYHDILDYEDYRENPNFVTGEKFCAAPARKC